MSDAGLLPRGFRRVTIALYLGTAACVVVASTLEKRPGRSWFEDRIVLALVAYCIAFALAVWRARPRPDPTRTDVRPYVLAFGDGPAPVLPPPLELIRGTGMLLPFALHAGSGLAAGLELALPVFQGVHGWPGLPFGGLGLLAGGLGLLTGWLPAIAFALRTRGAGWVVLAGLVGPYLLFQLAGRFMPTMPD